MALLPKRIRREVEHPLISFQQEMNRLMESFFGPWMQEFRGEWYPSVDVSETETDVVIKAELPGMKSSDINVTLSGNVLSISGEKKDERKESKGTYSLVERRYGKFHRSVTLPSDLETDKAEAEYKDGVLTVRVPKTERTKAKRVPVREERELAEAR